MELKRKERIQKGENECKRRPRGSNPGAADFRTISLTVCQSWRSEIQGWRDGAVRNGAEPASGRAGSEQQEDGKRMKKKNKEEKGVEREGKGRKKKKKRRRDEREGKKEEEKSLYMAEVEYAVGANALKRHRIGN